MNSKIVIKRCNYTETNQLPALHFLSIEMAKNMQYLMALDNVLRACTDQHTQELDSRHARLYSHHMSFILAQEDTGSVSGKQCGLGC